jgi:hypothetical protein
MRCICLIAIANLDASNRDGDGGNLRVEEGAGDMLQLPVVSSW